MSNFSKSRVLSLQLLTRLCDMTNGHKQVADAISMLRLRFGEPVRFKFLVGECLLVTYHALLTVWFWPVIGETRTRFGNRL